MTKKKAQKYKQQSGKHTYQTKDRVTRTPLKTVGEFRCSGTVGSSCSTSGILRFNLVKLKSSFRKFYRRHHDLVDRFGISLSQLTTDMFHLSQKLPGFFLIYDLLPDL
jgi:hypothetical protein